MGEGSGRGMRGGEQKGDEGSGVEGVMRGEAWMGMMGRG